MLWVSLWYFTTLQGFCHLLVLSNGCDTQNYGPFAFLSFISWHCPCSGLLLPSTLGRSWNSAAVIGWLGFALAAFCAFLRCLRQAKINWAESEVGAVSRFTRFTCEIGIAREFSSHFLSGVNWVFLWKPLLMATNLYDLFKPLPFLVSNAHFWLRHRCFLRVSPKPSSSGCIFPLWHRCFPLDFTGALFFVPSWDSAFFAPCLDFVGTCGPLHVFAKLDVQHLFWLLQT